MRWYDPTKFNQSITTKTTNRNNKQLNKHHNCLPFRSEVRSYDQWFFNTVDKQKLIIVKLFIIHAPFFLYSTSEFLLDGVEVRVRFLAVVYQIPLSVIFV